MKNDYEVKVLADLDEQIVYIREEVFGKICLSVLETKEVMIREALIKLGWTPPSESIHNHEHSKQS